MRADQLLINLLTSLHYFNVTTRRSSGAVSSVGTICRRDSTSNQRERTLMSTVLRTKLLLIKTFLLVTVSLIYNVE